MDGMDIAIKFSCSCFINNTARTGGALSVLSGLLIKQCHFISNFARLGGGVYTDSVITNNDTLKVIECMFANNTASKRAGAIYTAVKYVNIDNSNFTYNKAVLGGVLYIQSEMVNINQSI